MYTFWQILAATPWWIYLFFLFLANAGLAARKPRTISFTQLMIAPISLIAIYILGLYYLIEWNTSHLIMWLGMMLSGSFVGWVQCKLLGIQAIRDSDRLYIPASSIFLIVSIFVFAFSVYALRYYLIVDLQINFTPQLFHQPKYAAWLVMLYGLLTGLYLGRLLFAKQCLNMGPYFDLPVTQSVK